MMFNWSFFRGDVLCGNRSRERAHRDVVRRIGMLLLVLVTLCASATNAWADPKSEAQALLREGNELADAGVYGFALAKYREAYERFPSFKLHLNTGTALRALGRHAEALDSYERYLAHEEASPEMKRQVQPIVDELRGKVSKLTITLSEAGATVILGERTITLGAARETTLFVDPGTHVVRATLAGHGDAEASVTVSNAQPARITLTFESEPPPAESSSGALSGQGIAGIALGAAGVVGVALGAGFGISAINTQDDARATCRDGDVSLCTQAGLDLNTEAKTHANVSTVAFGVGGAALVGSAVLLFTADWSSEPESALRVVPTLDCGVAGLGTWGLGATGAF